MKKLSGFSLMEMMIVLLIVSIIAGATAPIINKKLVTAASEKSPWVWIGQGTTDIGYNVLGKTKTAAIGTMGIAGNIKPRLYIESDTEHPNIGLKYKDNNNSIAWNIATLGSSFSITSYNTEDTGSRYTPDTGITQAIAIGGNVSKSGATAVGYSAIASGEHSIALGSGYANGIKSIAIGGDDSSVAYASADSSIAIGRGTDALAQNSIAIGYNAAAAAYDDGNALSTQPMSAIAIGHNSEATGEYGIAIGGGNTSGPTQTRSWNSSSIAIGRGTDALTANSIAIGYNAVAGDEADTTKTNAVALGYGAKATASGSLAIGHGAQAIHENSVAIGPGAVTTAANQIVLGDSTTTVYIPGNLVVATNIFTKFRETGLSNSSLFPLGIKSIDSIKYLIPAAYKNDTELHMYNDIITSDRRLKNVGKAFKGGLEEIKKLEVFNYTFKKDKSKTPRVGVMAQDLEKIFPSAVTKGEDGFLRIRMEDMFYALVNAVKELDTKFDLLAQKQKKIDELEDKVSKLEKRLVELEKKIK